MILISSEQTLGFHLIHPPRRYLLKNSLLIVVINRPSGRNHTPDTGKPDTGKKDHLRTDTW